MARGGRRAAPGRSVRVNDRIRVGRRLNLSDHGHSLTVASLFDGTRLAALAAAAFLITACGGGGTSEKPPATKTTVHSATTKPKPAATRAPTDSAQLTHLLN